MKNIQFIVCMILLLLGNGCNDSNNKTVLNSTMIASAVAKQTAMEDMVIRVGPNQRYTNLQQIESVIQAGSTVYVDGDNEYLGSVVFRRDGTSNNPIQIIGVSINGKRPLIRATNDSDENLVTFIGNHYVFANFEVVGNMSGVKDTKKITPDAISQMNNDLLIRNCVVHDARNGIRSANEYSGYLTIESCDIYGNGYTESDSNIYIASDEVRAPHSVTMVRFNYIHDSKKGAGLTTRAIHNKIYYNRFVNNASAEVNLYGADLGAGSDPISDTKGKISGYASESHRVAEELKTLDKSYSESYIREDTDFVGNLVISNNKAKLLNLGGDGGSGGPIRNGTSFGRYRFVNNTFINTFKPSDNKVYFGQLMFGVGSLELYNNIFYNSYGTNTLLIFNKYDPNNDIHHNNSDLRWSNGRQIAGSNNWLVTGSIVPLELQNNLFGTDPGFINFKNANYNLSSSSPLHNRATKSTVFNFIKPIYYSNIQGARVEDKRFKDPLLLPEYIPVGPGISGAFITKTESNSVGAY